MASPGWKCRCKHCLVLTVLTQSCLPPRRDFNNIYVSEEMLSGRRTTLVNGETIIDSGMHIFSLKFLAAIAAL